jgi:hypothetical protein
MNKELLIQPANPISNVQTPTRDMYTYIQVLINTNITTIFIVNSYNSWNIIVSSFKGTYYVYNVGAIEWEINCDTFGIPFAVTGILWMCPIIVSGLWYSVDTEHSGHAVWGINTVLARPNSGIVGSNPTQGMDACVSLFCVCVVLLWTVCVCVCVCVCRIKKQKKRSRSKIRTVHL